MSLEFTITRHAHLSGVRLSLAGSHGNLPFPDDEEARIVAARIAGARPFTIERESFPALPAYTGCNHEHL